MTKKIFSLQTSLLVLGALVFTYVGYIETPIVVKLWQSPWPPFRDFMSDSMYEGGYFGASDIGVTAAIVCFFAWFYYRNTPERSRLFSHEELRFIWINSLMTAIVAVHSLKWIIGRERPKVFFETVNIGDLNLADLSSFHLPGFLPFIGPRGINLNSFPSGHTASCAILLTFCYVMWPKNRLVSLLGGIAVLTLACGMAMARSMAGMHWLSDSVASLFLTWSIIHFNWLKIKRKTHT